MNEVNIERKLRCETRFQDSLLLIIINYSLVAQLVRALH